MQREREKRWVDKDEIRDVDGVVAIITENTQTGRRCVGFFKEFDRDGDGLKERTAHLNAKQLDAVARLIPTVKKKLAEMEAASSSTSEDVPPIRPRKAGVR